VDHPLSGGTNDPFTDRYYIWDPLNMSAGSAGYNAWVALNNVIAYPAYPRTLGRQIFVSWNGGETTTSGPYNAPLPETGTIFRVNTTKPNNTADVFTITATGNTVTTAKKELKKGLKDIKVVPNPYYAQTSWQRGIFDKKIKFTNLPANCTIRIFTVSGDLVSTIVHNSSSNNDRANTVNPLDEGVTRGNLIQESLAPGDETSTEVYDLRNNGLKLIASGMYIALIDAPGIGTTTVKFAVIQQEILSNNPDVR
ncbi:hypothetical protein JNL27_04620, partial [bacterium]|nr:hypothetical protein [bacterium]